MKVAIIGTGPAGIMAGITAIDSGAEIIFFDNKLPLGTILPTGGGRCNLAFAEFDNTELVKYYPRGQKFLLSVFSKFSTGDTIEFFENIGIKTYIQDDLRIFPQSNSSKDVREKLLNKVKNSNVSFIKEKVTEISKNGLGFILSTEKKQYQFDKIVFAGGIKNNYEILKKLNIKLIEPKPALCAICAEDKALYNLSGVVLKNIKATTQSNQDLYGDLLITHSSLSGPLAYKISSTNAFEQFPYKIKLNFIGHSQQDFDAELIKLLDKYSKKDLINVISEFVPRSFAQYLFEKLQISQTLKANQTSKIIRNKLSKSLCEFELIIKSQKADGEIVTAGGVNLDFINPKTMEYKEIKDLYFCGEVLNIDGFTGGFNLQNCWSTGFIAGKAITKANNSQS